MRIDELIEKLEYIKELMGGNCIVEVNDIPNEIAIYEERGQLIEEISLGGD